MNKAFVKHVQLPAEEADYYPLGTTVQSLQVGERTLTIDYYPTFFVWFDTEVYLNWYYHILPVLLSTGHSELHISRSRVAIRAPAQSPCVGCFCPPFLPPSPWSKGQPKVIAEKLSIEYNMSFLHLFYSLKLWVRTERHRGWFPEWNRTVNFYNHRKVQACGLST